MRQQPNAVPKPFAWVPLPECVKPQSPQGHEQWQGDYTGSLECTLTLLAPLHVGSGLFCFANGEVAKQFVRQNDRLLIPGSSLKGVFRSIAEAISHSCVSKTRQNVPDKFRVCRNPKHLCVCCRLFGGLGYMGKVRFHDAHLQDNIEPAICRVQTLWLPQRSQQGRKFYKHGQPLEGNEPFEVLLPGTHFKFYIDVESLTKSEMCLLLTAMGILGNLKPKVGGAKPRCLGSVAIGLHRAHFWSASNVMLTYDRTEQILELPQLRQEIGNAIDLIDQDKLSRLRSILTYPGNEGCPPNLY